MRFHYPNSFLKLLLIGFAFAILPLLWAFINANIAFDRLAKQSQITINQAVESTKSGRILQEQLHLMERSIRQYYVLQDDIFFSHYQEAHTKFRNACNQLQLVIKSSSQQALLAKLSNDTEALHQSILSTKDKTPSSSAPEYLDTFSQLAMQIDSIVTENNKAIDSASTQLKKSAQKTQKNLLLQSLVLIPLALLVAGTIAYLLARPIRRMDSAISDLGAAEYDRPIMIDGPGDLRTLGKRLDWLRTELKNLNNQKQQFLQHVSHELKTPLTAIREATELLHDGIGGTLTNQQAEILLILRENSVRLQKMIENLLNFTHIEAIQPKLHLHPHQIKDIINKVLQAHDLSIRNKQLAIKTDFNLEALLPLDEEKVTIILDNLISNAVKYTQNHGEIVVNAAIEKNNLVLNVVDNGAGLAKEDIDKLFDPFYRGQTIHKGLINGSGLGLTIAKKMAEAHGGTITLVPSKQGAHFAVELPISN